MTIENVDEPYGCGITSSKVPEEKMYKNPSVTCDICILSEIKDKMCILLIKRKNPPFKNSYALPGGFLEIDKEETLEETAERELREETGVRDVRLKQLKTYGDPDRDPRKRVITVVFYATVNYNYEKDRVKAGDDAKEAKWFSLKHLPKLAFDHAKIIVDLKKKISQYE